MAVIGKDTKLLFVCARHLPLSRLKLLSVTMHQFAEK